MNIYVCVYTTSAAGPVDTLYKWWGTPLSRDSTLGNPPGIQGKYRSYGPLTWGPYRGFYGLNTVYNGGFRGIEKMVPNHLSTLPADPL